ncbi:MAG: isochorismatase family cysteine hydrolase [Patescibacteria group bacterium]
MNQTTQKKAALLVVDIQNDFCSSRGKFAKMGFDVSHIQKMVPRLSLFIKEIEKIGIEVFYSKQTESMRISPKNLKSLFNKGKLKIVCQPNSWGSELYRLKPSDNKNVLKKRTYDFLSNQKLNEILQRKKIKTLIITGVNTDICIDTTTRSAFTKGYNIIIPKDLVATINQKAHPYFLEIFSRFYGTVAPSKEILKNLTNKK